MCSHTTPPGGWRGQFSVWCPDVFLMSPGPRGQPPAVHPGTPSLGAPAKVKRATPRRASNASLKQTKAMKNHGHGSLKQTTPAHKLLPVGGRHPAAGHNRNTHVASKTSGHRNGAKLPSSRKSSDKFVLPKINS
eukprot:m.115843 g.115843  ORF g.115843 m.115843 type:complete len:134 (-) comp17156_c0_seq12:2188-2589(-)